MARKPAHLQRQPQLGRGSSWLADVARDSATERLSRAIMVEAAFMPCPRALMLATPPEALLGTLVRAPFSSGGRERTYARRS